MNDQSLPDFSENAGAPKRQRKTPAKKPRKSPKKRSVSSVVRGISSTNGPKRARKKRPARRLPKAVSASHDVHTGLPAMAPESAAIVRMFMGLDETQRSLVLNVIQAFR